VRIDFYHLTARPLEKVLPAICEKLVGAGERLLVVAGRGRRRRSTAIYGPMRPKPSSPRPRRRLQ
jgi:hypothetical protein